MKKRSVVRCQLSVVGCIAATDRPRTTDHGHAHRGVTLIELLITIMIISILAAMVLGAAAVAGNAAREAKTRNIVARLHTLLAEHADSYKTRRVRIRSQVEDGINTAYTGSVRGRALATARLFALREMMLMEMPDRWSDVLLADVPSSPTGIGDELYPVYLTDRTDLANIYLRRYVRTLQHLQDMVATGVLQSNEIRQKLLENQGAECLYMVITLACGDGEARSQFHQSDIGDTDGDGAPEFLDGWGNPISFLRWAPGFNSDIQRNANLLENAPAGPTNPTDNMWFRAANGDHDPYDMYRIDPAALRLVPLIFSAGRDETHGLFVADETPTWIGIQDVTDPFNPNIMTLSYPFSPYEELTEGTVTAYLGTDDGTGTATDNVHNHLIGGR